MSRHTLRIVIVLAAISIAGIVTTQLYWVRKAFDLKENQFNRDVTLALGTVGQKILEFNRMPSPSDRLVEQITTNYFVVLVNGPIDASVLEFLLVSEFEKRNIRADFEFGIYDCAEQCMVGGNYLSPKKTGGIHFPETPKLKNDGYYFAVQFPGLEANLVSQMGIWGFSSVVLLVVVFFFVYTLMVILRQRRLSEVQRDFINGMTHEFKTPISTIAISATVLQDPSIRNQPERLSQYAGLIQKEASRLEQQVERVLQSARLDKEEALKLETLDLHELIRNAMSSFQTVIDSKHGKMEALLCEGSATVTGDPMHLSNVLYNLLDNAIQYSEKPPHVVLSTTRSKTGLRLDIRDNGIGISPEEQKKIFDKFYRVPTGNIHNVKGFGIGLSYVQVVMKKLGGSVSVQSTLGEGSTFTLTFPA